LTVEKENKRSLGSSVESDIQDNETTDETMPKNILNSKEEEEKEP
jgi:hypothetical protein